MTDNALKQMEKPEVQSRINGAPILWSAIVSGDNHKLFHVTARVILAKKKGGNISQDTLDSLLPRAHDLLDETLSDARFLDKFTKAEWFEQQHTASFAMIHAGNAEEEK